METTAEKLARHYEEALEAIARLPDDHKIFGRRFHQSMTQEALEIAGRALRTAPHAS